MDRWCDHGAAKAGGNSAPEEAEWEKILREVAPIIKILARRFAGCLPSHMDIEDLESAGMIGLMDAMTKYDPSRRVKLMTYAAIRIQGAMMDEIRANDWLPRWICTRNVQLDKTHRRLVSKYGRPPTDEEMAPALGISVSELNRYLFYARRPIMLSLEDLVFEQDDGSRVPFTLIDCTEPDPLATLLAKNERERLDEAIGRLPKQEARVLTLYYFKDLTMRDIATVLNLTVSRICQIHAKALKDLKTRLQWVDGCQYSMSSALRRRQVSS